MTGLIKCKIPAELKSSLFFSTDEMEISPDRLQDWSITCGEPFFPYEILYWSALDSHHPWENCRKPINDLLARWLVLKEKAGKLFAERKAQETIEPMREGLSLLLSILFWLHSEPVHLMDWEDKLARFPYKPVNTEERLRFILARPVLYHSFVQLGELFTELEKQYHKKNILSPKKNV
ncbi:hypothetical protein ELQ35_10260 [Peribacillus cavernae]|uniref:YpoC-like domain-containing protein n=1 Tax=Peribacillus cavernae TaxID=1674310 RepID=A0A433HLV5_9BACI|nr:hypothetical protein [Peribacillus cavernae]MDQ0218952.1 hypothetical protein [Peribacillus cavernae]RUQ29340.1 hypothetical protein ELQ35_10260 [Peribacillus cavernae]